MSEFVSRRRLQREKFHREVEEKRRRRNKRMAFFMMAIFSALIFLIISFFFNQKTSIDSVNIDNLKFIDSKYEGVTSVVIERKNINEDVLLEYPKFGNSNIDKIIENAVNESDSSFKEIASSGENLKIHKISYQIQYSNEDFVSVLISGFQDFRGSAHPREKNIFWTFSKKTGEVIKFSNLLGESDDAENKFIEKSKEKIKQIADSRNVNLSASTLDALDFEKFENFIILDKNSISFPFSPTEILPSNFGGVDVRFKISELADFMQNSLAKKIFDIPEVKKREQIEEPKTPSLSGARCQNCVALTFDDGPLAGSTNLALDYLKKYNAKATFFVLGPNVERYADISKRIVDEGHEIGNHTWTHSQLPKISSEQVRDEISKTNSVIKNTTGFLPKIIRQPYGATNSNVQNILREMGMASILWSVDTRDWADRNSDLVCSRAVSSSRSGSIILMHDIHKTSVEAIPCIIQGLSNKGYKFVTVSELLGGLEAGQIYYSAN